MWFILIHALIVNRALSNLVFCSWYSLYIVQEYIETSVVTSPLLPDNNDDDDCMELNKRVVDIPV